METAVFVARIAECAEGGAEVGVQSEYEEEEEEGGEEERKENLGARMRRIGESRGFAVTVMGMGIARNVMFARKQSSEDIVRKTQTVVIEAERILNERNKRKAKNEFCWIAEERNV
jgi:hypothetical protein